jgi:REase_MTES_1575
MAPMPNASAILHDSDAKSRNRSLDNAVADLADRQHGVVSRSQLAGARLGRGAIGLRLAQGRLHRVHSAVFAVGHRRLTAEGYLMAAVLAGGRGAVLSHRSAAAHWGIRPSQATRTDVTTPRKLRSRGGLRFHCCCLPEDEVSVRDGIPVTTVARTLFDLAGVVPRRQFERAVNEAEIRRLWDALSLADLLERHPRRPGAAAIRALIEEPDGGITREELEERFAVFLEGAGLPRAATNLSMRVSGRWIEADCVWREQRLIVELDSHTYHGTRASFESDRARDRALTAAGWRVMRVTWRQLHDEPDALAEDLRAALTLG